MHKIIRVGDPRLQNASVPVAQHEFGTQELKELVDDMLQIMKQAKGVGLAAPQIGINKQIVVIGVGPHCTRKNATPVPDTVLINLSLTYLTEAVQEDYEGCLSVGPLFALVPRVKRVRYHARDFDGKEIEGEAEGLLARILQHEYNHLEGIIFFERVSNPRSFGYREELQAAGVFPSSSVKV